MGRKRIHKLKGGINPQGFIDILKEVANEMNINIDSGVQDTVEEMKKELEKGESWIPFEENESWRLEYYLKIIKRCLANGVYGDAFDRSLMYKGFNVFKSIQQNIRNIDLQRGKYSEEVFYRLEDWRKFYSLYKTIIEHTFETLPEPAPAPAPAPEPERTEWYKVFDKKTNEGWFVNSKTNESAWDLPPGGVEIPNLKPSLVSPAAEVTESAQIQALPAAIKKQIRDFSQLFKEIKIGKVNSNGLVSILPKYMSNVNLAILNTLGGMNVLNKLQQESRGYNDLYLLVQLLLQGTTNYDDISRIIAKRFPNEYKSNRMSGKTPTEKLIDFFELYEAEIIQDFINLLPSEGSGQRCKKCGGTKKSGYVQRLIAEKKLLPQKVKKPSSYIKKMKFNPDLEDLAKRMEGMGVKKGKKQSLPEINEF